MTTRAVGYVRVSTEGQAVEGVSLDTQRERIAAWCAANDFDLIETFADAGLSGKRADNRPGLQSAIALACRERAALVTFSLSRLARSVRDTLEIAARLERAHADLVSLSEKLDSTSAAGRMTFKLLAVLAEFERDLCAERTRGALARKKRLGEVVGTVPFGYRREGAKLIAIPKAQEALALIRELRAGGASYEAIARALAEREVATARGGKWTARTVWSIARRTAA
jgi:site-specific DNA recombinase